MAKQPQQRVGLLQGTLEMLILRTPFSKGLLTSPDRETYSEDHE
jgi:hypothetical protein